MKHLTQEQRYVIFLSLDKEKTQKEIAKELGVSASTISRELRRNCDERSGRYFNDLAHRKAENRHRIKAKKKRLTSYIIERIEALLAEEYSPEQIAATLEKEGKGTVSTETIYKHIWLNKKRKGTLYTHLRNKGRRYNKRGNKTKNRGVIPDRVSIDERPKIVDEKTRFGDLEVDTIIGKNHKGAIVTINDRKTGLLRLKKVATREAAVVKEAIIELLIPFRGRIHTMTSDNGKEFALHKEIASTLGISFYFADPYSPWQRGANENLNRLVRQYIPKKSNFSEFDDAFVMYVQEKLNNRPRKRLNFSSPSEVYKIAFMT
jgi:IS30 family transposase